MRIRLKPWLFLTLLAAVVALSLFLLDRTRYRFVRSDAEMVAMLPQRGLTTFFLDFDLLRRAHLLNLFSETSQETDYRKFVSQTGFDYAKDIDVLAGEGDGSQLFFYVRGRFDWSRLRTYAATHGGACKRDWCQIPTTTPGRWASFLTVQPNVMALALGADAAAVLALKPRHIENPPALPGQPVWVKVAPYLLSDPKNLPMPAQILAMALESSDLVTFSAGLDSFHSGQFQVKMEARCRNHAIADTTRKQLEIQTKMLALELAREHEKPNPADLTGLLTAGSFEVQDKTVIGTWPLRHELLERLK